LKKKSYNNIYTIIKNIKIKKNKYNDKKHKKKKKEKSYLNVVASEAKKINLFS
jgi:hypothetical protein